MPSSSASAVLAPGGKQKATVRGYFRQPLAFVYVLGRSFHEVLVALPKARLLEAAVLHLGLPGQPPQAVRSSSSWHQAVITAVNDAVSIVRQTPASDYNKSLTSAALLTDTLCPPASAVAGGAWWRGCHNWKAISSHYRPSKNYTIR